MWSETHDTLVAYKTPGSISCRTLFFLCLSIGLWFSVGFRVWIICCVVQVRYLRGQGVGLNVDRGLEMLEVQVARKGSLMITLGSSGYMITVVLKPRRAASLGFDSRMTQGGDMLGSGLEFALRKPTSQSRNSEALNPTPREPFAPQHTLRLLQAPYAKSSYINSETPLETA